MKSILKDPTTKTTANEIKFPVLARLKCEGTNRSSEHDKIVMFTDYQAGTCVWAATPEYIGEANMTWIPVTDTSVWKILPAGVKVVLSN